MTIDEFLLARIIEDETNDTTLIGVARKDWSARWAAECKAKRRLVEVAKGVALHTALEWGEGAARADLLDILSPLAVIYADHPDFDESWR